MKVLISAYACAPDRGSEPAVGWNVATQVARYHDTWVLTSTENEAAIRDAMRRGVAGRLNILFVEPLGWTLDLATRRRPIPLIANAHYYAWQARAYLEARALHRVVRFDVAHHVTFVRYYTPSLVSLLPVPFVWGPVGGGESAPFSFWLGLGLRGLTYEVVRATARRVGEWDPFVRMTARRSTIARATTPATAHRLLKLGVRDIAILSETGIGDGEAPHSPGRPTAREGLDGGVPFYLTLARLLPWKGVHLALQAFALASPAGVRYRIVGPGPDRARLERLARRLNIQDRVEFTGELSREHVYQLISSCLALVHPSLHDSGGRACLEAMAAGKPVICLDIGGPATQVTDETGFVVRASTPRRAIRGIAEGLRRLAENEALRTAMGENARGRIRDSYTWEGRGRVLSGLYMEAARRHGTSE